MIVFKKTSGIVHWAEQGEKTRTHSWDGLVKKDYGSWEGLLKDAKVCVCVGREGEREGEERQKERELSGGREKLVVPFHLGPSLFF